MRAEPPRLRATSAATVACLVTLLTGCGLGQSAADEPTATASVSTSPSPTATAPAPAPTASTPPPATGTAPPPPDPSPADGRTAVSLQVTSAGWDAPSAAVEVAGFVPVLEADGVCHLVLTRAASTVTADQAAQPGPSSTDCGVMSVAGSRLSPGTWTAQLTYESSTSVGVAAPQQIEVP